MNARGVKLMSDLIEHAPIFWSIFLLADLYHGGQQYSVEQIFVDDLTSQIADSMPLFLHHLAMTPIHLCH
jgi:hypothetical protein